MGYFSRFFPLEANFLLSRLTRHFLEVGRGWRGIRHRFKFWAPFWSREISIPCVQFLAASFGRKYGTQGITEWSKEKACHILKKIIHMILFLKQIRHFT